MRDEALKALLEERWLAALAKYSERLPRNPRDDIARSNRAVALYEAGRWAEAAKAFEDLLRREGPASEIAPPALFSLGYCRLELGDDRGALEASTLFIELSNERHPFYRDGVHNIACAADRLGEHAAAASLYRAASGKARRWTRKRILRAAFRVLGWHRKPLPASRLIWRRDRRALRRRRRADVRAGPAPPATPARRRAPGSPIPEAT
jgi:tetratricopeptide (TPR) repeat protein